MLAPSLHFQANADPQLLGISLVVPCFDEKGSIDQLADRIHFVRDSMPTLQLEVIFVDDGSSDGTAEQLEEQFAACEWAKVVRHQTNLGIAAAIMTGARVANHDIVVSMDADCTYDPMQLPNLIAQMHGETVLVTASPYHPKGVVEGIPTWRLGLSKTASHMYSWLLGTKIHTFTSCFRAYRRTALLQLELQNHGFVGIAEMLWRLSRRGQIVEVPATLTTRRVGSSKMRTIPVALAHLRLMLHILLFR